MNYWKPTGIAIHQAFMLFLLHELADTIGIKAEKDVRDQGMIL